MSLPIVIATWDDILLGNSKTSPSESMAIYSVKFLSYFQSKLREYLLESDWCILKHNQPL
jgi:hypothetical protein